MKRASMGSITELALAVLVACGCTHSSPRSNTMSDPTVYSREQNKQCVQRLFDTFNQGDLSPIDDLVGPDYRGAQGEKGPAGFKTVVVGLRTAFPDLHYTLDDVIAEGNQVAVRWHWTGSHKGSFRAFPATGKTVLNTGAGIFQVEGGKIVSATLETDRLGFLEQIGAVPEGVGRGPRPPASDRQ